MNDKNSKKDYRPWGYYEILFESEDLKIKRIIVYPGKRMSLQLHYHRSEHWFIIRGEGKVTLDNDNLKLGPYQSINIPLKTPHRIQNTGIDNLVFIEIQTGDYFGEDDIKRIEDDFGRI
ncbi:phosphomannose isomerase type II C-terminal cupin domain [bacterium]|nr:phosphomannose isomerase type II C-terminal cupin domain [bacterium]